jgi:hypothetical protein
MKNWPFVIGGFAIALIVSFYFWMNRPDTPPIKNAQPPSVVEDDKAVAIQHPINRVQPPVETVRPIIDPEQPLPELNQSDERMEEILSRLFVDQKLNHFFILDHFIERSVVMIDSLPRQDLPATHRPVKKIPGAFLAMGPAEELTIDPANGLRYKPVIDLIVSVDSQTVVAIYARLYSLFQEAYRKLGYRDRYFNDRLVEVIDHLLNTPKVSEPIRLKQPKALYLFADPKIESLSSGRKIMIRIGPENAEQVKHMLRGYRKELTGVELPVQND